MAKYITVPTKVVDYITTNDIRNDFLQIEQNDHKFEMYFVDANQVPVHLGTSNRSATEFISSDDVVPVDPLYPELDDFIAHIDSTKLDDSLFYYTGTTTDTDAPKIIIQRIGGVNTVMYTETLPTIHGTVTFDVTADLGLIPGERIKVSVVSDTSLPNPWSIVIEGETSGIIDTTGKISTSYLGAKAALVTVPSGSPVSVGDATLYNNGLPYHDNNFICVLLLTVQHFKYNDFSTTIGEIYAGNKFTFKFIGDPAFKV